MSAGADIIGSLVEALGRDLSERMIRSPAGDREIDPAPDREPPGDFARADALVRKNDRSMVVEVRARLQPGTPAQFTSLRNWLHELPSDLPVLLVVPGEGLSRRELNELRNRREGAIGLLSWDTDADSLITVVRGLLEHSGDTS